MSSNELSNKKASLDISKFHRIVVYSTYPKSQERWAEFIHPLYIHNDKETFEKLMHNKDLQKDTLFVVEDSDLRQQHHFQSPNLLYAVPSMLIGKQWFGLELQQRYARIYETE